MSARALDPLRDRNDLPFYPVTLLKRTAQLDKKRTEVASTRRLFISIKVNILKASVVFYAITIFVTCERNFGYLLLFLS